MDADIRQKLEELEKKIDAVFVSTEKMRKYFLIVTWVTVIMILLPLVLGAFFIPKAISSYTQMLDPAVLDQ